MKKYNCWVCDEWINERDYMNHIREHERNDEWIIELTFPSSLDDAAKRFPGVGLLKIIEVEDENDENLPLGLN